MDQTKVNLLDKLFAAYGTHDLAGLHEVMTENVQWIFPGRNVFSGVKSGIREIVDFFDQIGSLMIQSKVQVEKLAVCSDDNYLIEYQHIKTNRNDGINIDHYWCVLWKFDHNKICEGRHLAGDQYAIDDFLTKITSVSRKKTKKTAKEPVTLH